MGARGKRSNQLYLLWILRQRRRIAGRKAFFELLVELTVEVLLVIPSIAGAVVPGSLRLVLPHRFRFALVVSHVLVLSSA